MKPQVINTATFGAVLERMPYEPAPLLCEGPCNKTTMHSFDRRTQIREEIPATEHDMYRCDVCGISRIWG